MAHATLLRKIEVKFVPPPLFGHIATHQPLLALKPPNPHLRQSSGAGPKLQHPPSPLRGVSEVVADLHHVVLIREVVLAQTLLGPELTLNMPYIGMHRCIRDWEPGWGQKQGRGSFKKGAERTHRSRKWGKGWLGSKARFVKGGGGGGGLGARRSRQRSVVGTRAQNCELTASVDRL